jgi:hypothetical protein
MVFSGFPTTILYAFLFSPIRATYLAHLFLLGFDHCNNIWRRVRVILQVARTDGYKQPVRNNKFLTPWRNWFCISYIVQGHCLVRGTTSYPNRYYILFVGLAQRKENTSISSFKHSVDALCRVLITSLCGWVLWSSASAAARLRLSSTSYLVRKTPETLIRGGNKLHWFRFKSN